MGYVLNFWRHTDEDTPRTPEEALSTMRSLYDDSPVDDVLNLDTEALDRGLQAALTGAGWTREDRIFYEKDGVVVEVYLHPQHVHAELRGRWTGDDANLVIEYFSGARGLPFFDPQIRPSGERFPAIGTYPG